MKLSADEALLKVSERKSLKRESEQGRDEKGKFYTLTRDSNMLLELDKVCVICCC